VGAPSHLAYEGGNAEETGERESVGFFHHAFRTGYPRLIKHGSVVVKGYRAKQKTTAAGWAYVLVWVSGSRRRLQQFADESEAVEEGRRV